MRPEADSLRVLSTTRAKAKMYEFRVPPDDHIALPQRPSILFSLAVGILGDAAAAIASAFLGEPPAGEPVEGPAQDEWDSGDASIRENSRDAITFAAVYFDAFLGSRLDESINDEFSLLCACAYYLSDSPGSARVVARHIPSPPPALEGGLPRLAHSILLDDHAAIEEPYDFADLCEPLRAALRSFLAVEADGGAIVAGCRAIRDRAYLAGSAGELLYADLIVALCERKLANASRNLLPPASGLALDAWRPALAKPRFPKELWPAQIRLCDAGLLKGESAVIQMPTSAGKTRATELIIRSAFLSDRTSLAVIVAPFRSLCHDIRGDLAVAFSGENVSLSEATDAYQFDMSLEDLFARKTVLIVTPEKLLYMLRRAPQLSDQIGLVIYDEGHQFDGMSRGPTYELLLTSLKIMLGADTQVVLISAVIGNAGVVAEWLIGNAGAVVTGDGLLPTTKSIAFASWATERGRLEYVSPEDPEEREFFVPRVIEAIQLGQLPRERAARFFPERNGGDVGLYLGLQLVSNGSVAIFCGRKDSAALLCERAVEVFDREGPFTRPIDTSDAAEVGKIASLFRRHEGNDASATQAATIGIFAHHANVPHGLRLAIEHAMKEGLATFVICTSTLAQGVNFPIKYLIVTTTQQGQERIMVRDFHNLIGRAGRAGMHTEGSVIFSAPELYDQRRQNAGRWRWRQAKDLLDATNAEPVTSSILAVFQPFEQTFPPIVLQISTAQLQALAFADANAIEAIVNQGLAINAQTSAREFRNFLNDRARAVQSIATFLLSHVNFEEDDAGARAAELAQNTLAFHLADATTRAALVELFEGIAGRITANADADLRSFIRKSPLPPSATADLQAWLSENEPALAAAVEGGTLLEAIFPKIAAHLTSSAVRSFPNAGGVVPTALRGWIEGDNFEGIRAPMVAADIRVGNHRVRIEDVVGLCENGFGYDAAMIVAALADLAEPGNEVLHTALALLQQRIKYGLREAAAIAFYEAGFADRVIATELADQFPATANRHQARVRVKAEPAAFRAALADYPSYFTAVLDEVIAS